MPPQNLVTVNRQARTGDRAGEAEFGRRRGWGRSGRRRSGRSGRRTTTPGFTETLTEKEKQASDESVTFREKKNLYYIHIHVDICIISM